MRVNVGDIVTISHPTFDGEFETSMFIVVYHEYKDIPTSNKFSAVKLSTREGGYDIVATKEYLPFLNHDSYILCSSLMKFSETQVINIIGRLNTHYLNKILGQLRRYFDGISKQMIETIGEDKLFDYNRDDYKENNTEVTS